MRLVLDAGALIAAERRPVGMALTVQRLATRGVRLPLLPATVLAQVWRTGSGRQAGLARIVADCEIAPLDDVSAREVGRLLEQAGTIDIVDAHVVLVSREGDTIVTSDPVDIARLAKAAGKRVHIAVV